MQVQAATKNGLTNGAVMAVYKDNADRRIRGLAATNIFVEQKGDSLLWKCNPVSWEKVHSTCDRLMATAQKGQ